MISHHDPIAIVGPGRVGQALGKLLALEGWGVSLIAGRRPSAVHNAARFIGAGRPVGMNAPELGEASVILITVSDWALEPVARGFAALRKDWSGRVVLHTSGSVPASVLSPCQRRGAAIGSFHPFQTIPNPTAGVQNLWRCFWGIEGDNEAREVATAWIEALHGTVFPIHPEKKILYHASAFLVCPTVVTLLENSERLLAGAGVPRKLARKMLGPFVVETVRNFVELGGRGALTGPATRGDWAVIKGHMAALRRESPEMLPLYRELVRAMLRVVGKKAPRGVL